MAPAITLVHLASGSLGPEPTRRFADALRAHGAGCDHELVIVFNGVPDAAEPAFAAALAGLEHASTHLAEPVIDLAAYAHVLPLVGTPQVCLCNSGAQPRVDGWLAIFSAAMSRPGVGLVGASGSWESAFSSAPAKYRVQRAVAFPPFPNPSLRTNAFGGATALLGDLDWGPPATKLAALKLESGRRSLTRQVLGRGLQTVVAGADEKVYAPDDWPASATFRAGGQRNLLVDDNRTADYARADAGERGRLARMAWGRAALGD